MTTVTKNDILAALRELGIENGDVVHFHSSLKSMGHVENGADAVIDAFLEAVGEEGTVAVPTLSQKNFDRAYEDWTLDRPSDVGLITETFRLRKEAKRSDQATHSVAAIGKLAEYITADHGKYGLRQGAYGDTPFAVSSPWQKYHELNAKLVFVGVSMGCNTFKHYIEYRVIEDKLSLVKDKATYDALLGRLRIYGRPGMWPYTDFIRLQSVLDEAGLLKKAPCGNTEFLCANAAEMYDFSRDLFEREPAKWLGGDVAEWVKQCEAAAE
ncbi:MAG: AAC(3) family N-acetyltransferase [Clostridia bacterium]|nr:AAC(3) family N-acetyltransferase [Clostridia bacterium]